MDYNPKRACIPFFLQPRSQADESECRILRVCIGNGYRGINKTASGRENGHSLNVTRTQVCFELHVTQSEKTFVTCNETIRALTENSLQKS